jgi:hypothetical protein
LKSRLLARLALLGLVASVLTVVPVHAASAAESTGTGISYTLEGCRASTDAYLPGTFICPDSAYTTGNLGGGWNEFDLVPGRITLDAGNNAPANQTFSFVVAVDNCSTTDGATGCSGFPGYDRLSVPVLNTSLSSGDCGTVQVSGEQYAAPGIGGTGTTLYRTVTVTGQDPGAECVYDFFARLAFDSHLYPGASLHFNLANTDLKTAQIGARDVSIPVKEILPPGFSKTQTATQGSSVVWAVNKSATPTSSRFTETCPPTANPQSTPVTVTVSWTKQTAAAGDITVQTQITVTNNAHRPIDVTVSDQLYTGAAPASGNEVGAPDVTQITALLGTQTFTNTFTVPAGTATVFSDRATATFKDTFFQEVLGTATATATSGVQTLAPSSGATAVITDVEGMTGDAAYDFTVDSVSGVAGSFSNYTVGSGTHTRGPVNWSSGTQSSSGSTTFNKTVYVNAPTTGSATLSDTATITPAGQSATTASASSTFSSNATVSLTINKTIPVVLDSNDATQTFTFPVTGPGGAVSPSPTISFGPGDGGSLNPKSVTLTGLAPGSYTVAETTLSPYAPQTSKTVAINLPTCSNATTFTNTFGLATAAAKKVTVPAGGEAGWQFTLKRNGVVVDSGTTNANGDLVWASNGATTIQLTDEGSYAFEEVVKAGWDQDASGTSGCSFTVDYPASADATFTCTFRNVQRGRIIVDKVTQPSGDPTLFTFNPSWSTTDFQLADATAPHDSGLLQPGSYNVSETVPADWQLLSSTCTDGTATYSASNITLVAGRTVTCTFTNRKFGHARVVKTVNGGAIPSGQSFIFQVRSGATPSAVGTVLETQTVSASNSGTATFATNLVPGQTYQFCEAEMVVGWHSSLSDVSGSFVPGGIDNSAVCVNFTVAAGELKTFTVDNTPPPGGDARTIGYWKTHASCSTTGARKRPKLDQTLAEAEPGGIRIGDLFLHGSTSTPNVAPDCVKAVRILNKSRIDTGAKMASDPAFNLAAQLLAAKLNIVADAGTCAAANTAITQAQALLDAINFNGITHTVMTSTQKTQANALASTLDRYNNNTLC